jgi:type I restriction enzyme S subunit
MQTIAAMPLLMAPKAEQVLIAETLDDAQGLAVSLERLIVKKQAIKQGMMQLLLTGKTRLSGFSREWTKTSMGESGSFSGAGVDKTSNPGELPVRLLNYVDVYHEEFVHPRSPRQMITASALKQRQCDIQAGDVFFTPTSETPDDIGRSAVALQSVPGAVYSYHLVRWRPRDSWDPIFLGFAFNTVFFRSQVVALASGSGARYVISMPGFRSLKIARPPLEEQEAIGRMLLDLSSQIEILKDRLTKVRAIKQGMMQELLTGRTRLFPVGEAA